ncbi:MAG: CbtB domain-containing protein [Acidimicrobiales bacterium]
MDGASADLVPLRPIRVPALAWLAAALATVMLYAVLQDNGLLLRQSWETMHEFFHDGRHFLAVPCH